MTDLSRRELLAGAAALVGGTVLAALPESVEGQAAKAAAARPVAPQGPTKLQGGPTSAVGTRSPYVTPARTPTGETVGNSLTPHPKAFAIG